MAYYTCQIKQVLPGLITPTQLPLWALISFACYSAAVIGWGLMTFPTCPEAAASLHKARHLLRAESRDKPHPTKVR